MTNYPLHVNDDGLAPRVPSPAVPPTTEQVATLPLPASQSQPESLEARLFREGYLTAEQLSELVRVHVQTQRPMESLVAELGVVPLSALESSDGADAAEVKPLPTWDGAGMPEVAAAPGLPAEADMAPLTAAEEHPHVQAVVDSNPNPEVDLEVSAPAVVEEHRVVFDVVVRTENGGEVTTATCASSAEARAEAARLVRSLDGRGWLETESWSIRYDVVVAVGSRPRVTAA